MAYVKLKRCYTRTERPAPAQALDQDEREQLALIHTLVGTVRHFFGGFASLFRPIHDPRVPYLITYPLDSMCFAGVSMFLCRLGARRQINHLFRSNGPSEAKFQALFGVETCPHGDTMNVLYSRCLENNICVSVSRGRDHFRPWGMACIISRTCWRKEGRLLTIKMR